ILRLPFVMRRRRREMTDGVMPPALPAQVSGSRSTRRLRHATHRVRLPLFGFERAWGRAAFDALFREEPGKTGPLGAVAPDEPDGLLVEFFDSVPLVTRI